VAHQVHTCVGCPASLGPPVPTIKILPVNLTATLHFKKKVMTFHHISGWLKDFDTNDSPMNWYPVNLTATLHFKQKVMTFPHISGWLKDFDKNDSPMNWYPVNLTATLHFKHATHCKCRASAEKAPGRGTCYAYANWPATAAVGRWVAGFVGLQVPYGVVSVGRIDKIVGLLCKGAL